MNKYVIAIAALIGIPFIIDLFKQQEIGTTYRTLGNGLGQLGMGIGVGASTSLGGIGTGINSLVSRTFSPTIVPTLGVNIVLPWWLTPGANTFAPVDSSAR
jgi:hypothetical protein